MTSDNITPNDFDFYLSDYEKILSDHYCHYEMSHRYGNDITSAIRHFEKEISNNPTNPQIAWSYYNLGECLLLNKNYSQAKENFSKAAEEDTELKGDAYFKLGCIKTLLSENSVSDLENAVYYYKKGGNPYADYAISVLDSFGKSYNTLDNFEIEIVLKNGKLSTNLNQNSLAELPFLLSLPKILPFLERHILHQNIPMRKDGHFKISVKHIDKYPERYISECYVSGMPYDFISDIFKKNFL